MNIKVQLNERSQLKICSNIKVCNLQLSVSLAWDSKTAIVKSFKRRGKKNQNQQWRAINLEHFFRIREHKQNFHIKRPRQIRASIEREYFFVAFDSRSIKVVVPLDFTSYVGNSA